MAMSGITVTQECKEMFNSIKEKHTHGYAVMKISDDDKEVILVKSVPPHPDKTAETSKQIFDEMKAEILKDGSPCYILFDLSYKRKNGTSKDVVCYIYWCDDRVQIKKKMKYAATSKALEKAFTGIKHFECHDEGDFSYEEIANELISKDRA